MNLSTTYRPNHLWSSFFIACIVVIFYPLSQTLSLTSYNGASLQWVSYKWAMALAAWEKAECASFVAASIWEVKSLSVSRCDSLIGSIMSHGFCLVSSMKGEDRKSVV